MKPFIPVPLPYRLLALSLLGVLASATAQADELPSVDQAHLDIVSSNTGPTHPASGLDINTFLGADRFYNNGYTGTRAIMANIEGQHISSSHETLTHVSTFVTGTGALGTVGSHPTAVGQAMGGKPLGSAQKSGIAPNATLWSGAIATGVNGGSFDITAASIASTYSSILKTGVNGQTADVFNSSWGFTAPTGANLPSAGIDGLLYQTGKVGVVAAGNSGGTSSPQVESPAAGYNSIAVAALGSDTSNSPYNQVSGFSSRGPNDYYNPNNGQTIAGVRARVDIAAPGQNLTLATTGSPTSYATNAAGTSFAAPLVAGGAALVVDAGKAIYANDASAIDGRVVKAVLLNGADKTQGWNNGQQLVNGVVTTTQSLDYAAGAGRMNLSNTYDQYVDTAHGGEAGTTDLTGTGCHTTGTCVMGNVSNTGWDYGWANQNGTNLYYIAPQLTGGNLFTATLNWFADINPGSNADFSGAQYNHLADLDLYVFEYDPLNQAILRIVAESVSTFNAVEHLSFLLPSTGNFGLAVDYFGDLFNFNNATGEYFGLAWTTEVQVPEPASILLVLAGIGAYFSHSRRKAHQS